MVRHESEIRSRPVYGDGKQRVYKQILVGPQDGYQGFLREFTLDPGASSPYHQHDWHHVVYILEGNGLVKIEGEEQPLRRGTVVHAEAGKIHGFFNTGSTPLRFLCLVPEKGDEYPEKP